MFMSLKTDNVQKVFLRQETNCNYNLTFIILEKRQYLQHHRSNKGFKGTVVNRAPLHGGSLEITLTLPF